MNVSRNSDSEVKLVNSVLLPPMSETVVQAYLNKNVDGNTGITSGSELDIKA
jgi:hypothetical protein